MYKCSIDDVSNNIRHNYPMSPLYKASVIRTTAYDTDVVSSNLDQGEVCTTLCDKVCQRLATGRWFSPASPVSSSNTTDRHDIAEILLKVALNTIKQTFVEQVCTTRLIVLFACH